MPKFPWQQNGMCYGYDAGGQRICTGAMMGRANCIPDDPSTVSKLQLRKVQLHGDYDAGGAYWGGGSGTPDLYCAFGSSDTEQVEFWTRADSREQAKQDVLAVFKNAAFFN